MGDRGVIYIKSGDFYAPCGLYVHWNGEELVDWFTESIPLLRKDDPDYSMARLIGTFHEKIDGNTGLGVVNAPNEEDIKNKNLKKYSHGDAGILVYDCKTGKAFCAHGYLEDKYPEEFELEIPPS